jgi:hypothetical protein
MKKQIKVKERVSNFQNYLLGGSVALMVWIHNEFFLGAAMAIALINLGYYLISKKKNFKENLIKLVIFGLFSSNVFYYATHSPFAVGYQVGIVLILIGSYITYLLYRSKK